MVKRAQKVAQRSLSVRFRGERVGPAQIEAIRSLIRAHAPGTLRELTTLLCQAWHWRRPNGALQIRSCRDLLVRLERSGEIGLPTRTRRSPSQRVRRIEPSHWEEAPRAIRSHEVDLRRVVVRPLRGAEVPRWREAMRRFHYLGDGVLVGESFRYVAEEGSTWLALLGWGAAALRSAPREAFVGWQERQKLRRLRFVANNQRFLVLPWVEVPHLASFVLAANLRRLSRDWQRVYGHGILLAETFVDFQRFRGTCYRASNWRYLGETRGHRREGRGYVEHGQPKGLFVYPLHRRTREILSSPFPSPEVLEKAQNVASCTIDVNKLPLEGKGGLIEVLRALSDPRDPQGIRHPFTSVLALALMATLCGRRNYEAIAEWAKELPRELLKKLRCWCAKAPSEPTFRRVLQSINAQEVDDKVGQWLATQPIVRNAQAIALDGKTLRGSGDGTGSPCHLLSAVTHGESIVTAQRSVGEKTNEITASKPLLKDVELKGKTVTADAMHTQTDFARFVVEEKSADYVLIAKENQPTLLSDIKLLYQEPFSPSGEHTGQGARTDRDARD